MAIATDTNTYKFNHSMLRVKDPKESVKFYEFLGMSILRKLSFPEAKFDLYFMGYTGPGAASHGRSATDREGIIELTHNYGTEAPDSGFVASSGNVEPHTGFAHVGISVDNIQAACERIERAGYRFQQRSLEASVYVLDPDGYSVEIYPQKMPAETEGVTTTDVGTYRMHHTMMRIKDPKKSLAFYRDVLGMFVQYSFDDPANGVSAYFVCYPGGKGLTLNVPTAATGQAEGLLELTWYHGTEKDDAFQYHSGNEEPKGFGHICIAVDDLDAACERFEELGIPWKKRLTDGWLKNVAFILDPDGYWVELIQNDKYSDKYAL